MITLKDIENYIKKHILISIILTFLLGSIIGPIIVQNYIWNKEPTPIIFSDKEIMNLSTPNLYDVTSFFSVFNPTKEKIVINLPFVKIPNEIFYGTPLNFQTPKITPVEANTNLSIQIIQTTQQKSIIEIDSGETLSFPVKFTVNITKKGVYPITYCIKTIDDKIFCDDGKYLSLLLN